MQRRCTAARVPALLIALFGLAACAEDTAGEGEPCARAQDCDASLVCAYLDDTSEESVCAQLDDTRDRNPCMPAYPGMACPLVLRDTPDAGS